MYAWFDIGKLFIMNYHNKQIHSLEIESQINYNVKAYTHQFVSLLFWKWLIPESMDVSAILQHNNTLKKLKFLTLYYKFYKQPT